MQCENVKIPPCQLVNRPCPQLPETPGSLVPPLTPLPYSPLTQGLTPGTSSGTTGVTLSDCQMPLMMQLNAYSIHM